MIFAARNKVYDEVFTIASNDGHVVHVNYGVPDLNKWVFHLQFSLSRLRSVRQSHINVRIDGRGDYRAVAAVSKSFTVQT